MAVTRRQFVAGMSALAASMGFNSAQIAKITEALAVGGLGFKTKPKVLWVHGAECTGCSVSLLSLYEDARGLAIRGTNISTLAALELATDAPGGDVLTYKRTLQNNGFNVDGSPYAINVQDILIDWVDLQYHETVQSMGGDLGYRVLAENMVYSGGDDPFVLVVEGAVQDKDLGGAWGDAGHHPWCSIGMPDTAGTAVIDGTTPLTDLSFDDVVQKLAERADCAAVIAIGQCATFGGIPASTSPEFTDILGVGQGDNKGRQTGAMGTHEFLLHKGSAAADKVVNVPGCPTNPWWFVLTVVAFLVDLKATLGALAGTEGPLGILTATAGLPAITGGVDATRRLTAVYGTPLHGPACARYGEYVKGNFADNPGEDGCLQLIGCKGPSVNSTCGVHGWNGQQPENREALRGAGFIDSHNVADFGGKQGGNCIMAGHPCMGCTEQGYPDAFVPFVVR
ncbi:MAG: hypothetical protein P1P71_06550 [Anaerosomatales bacterium]|nr:hypothetical protein [Anaerosomatales bacterium]